MRKTERIVYISLMLIYLLVCVWIILFHANVNSFYSMFSPDFRSLNFRPYFNGIESILNIGIFIPLGLYIEMLFDCKKITKALIVFGVTAIFEIAQYVFALGTSDIMDIINNWIGGMIGIALCITLKSFCKEKIYQILLFPAILCTMILLVVALSI